MMIELKFLSRGVGLFMIPLTLTFCTSQPGKGSATNTGSDNGPGQIADSGNPQAAPAGKPEAAQGGSPSGNDADPSPGEDGPSEDQSGKTNSLLAGKDLLKYILFNPSVSIVMGKHHACALYDDGKVRCWGKNAYGQLGNGTLVDHSEPSLAGGLENVRKISAGRYHTCAVTEVGKLFCWGDNKNGQLGINSYVNAKLPTQVTVLESEVRDVVAGYGRTCAIMKDRTLYCWGGQETHDLEGPVSYQFVVPKGNDPPPDSNSAPADDEDLFKINSPRKVNQVEGVRSVALGYDHTCFSKIDGTVLSWGSDLFGEMGDSEPDYNDPDTGKLAKALIKDVRAVVAGSNYSCALKADETVWCWGYDRYGQLGKSSETPGDCQLAPSAYRYCIPGPVEGMVGVKKMVAGFHFNAALKSDGSVWAWGDNQAGQVVKDSSVEKSPDPIEVPTDALEKVENIGGSYQSLCLIDGHNKFRCQGTARTWGLDPILKALSNPIGNY